MEKLVELDPYEDFKNNGVYSESETYCESCYDDNDCSFTSYDIIEKEVK